MNVNLFGQIYGCMGIPNHTRDLFREIIKQVPDARIYPLYHEGSSDHYDIDPTFQAHVRPNPTIDKVSGLVFVFWGPDLYPRVLGYTNRAATIAVGYLIFEWTNLAKDYVRDALLMDYLAVPSQWHKEVLLANGIPENKIIILPAGVNPAYLKDYPAPSERRKFLFVGKYEKRKCVDELIAAFGELHGRTTLSLLCSDPHDRNFNVNRLPGLEKINNIIFPAKPQTPEQMAALYAAHDFILVPSRSGGIELPLIEAMACGCVPIVTKTSGMQHYLPPNYSWFLKVKSLIPMYDNRWFRPSQDWGFWAEPDWDNFKYLLTAAKDIRPEAESEQVKAYVRFKYNYPDIVKALLQWATLVDRSKKC